MAYSNNEQSLCVLFVPLSTSGHINASIGLAHALQRKGHRVVFAAETSWSGKLVALGFEEEIYTERELKEGEDPGKYWSDTMKSIAPFLRKPMKEKVTGIVIQSYREFTDAVIYSDSEIKAIVDRVKPDVIVQDNYVCYPSLVTSGKPLILLNSANPLGALTTLKSSKLPPPNFGLSLGDNSDWEECRQAYENGLKLNWNEFNQWAIKRGAPSLPAYNYQFVSTNLNLFVYPKSFASDYLEKLNLGDEWMGLDHSVRITNTKFELPSKLLSVPGKLILFSLGSMGASADGLMKRLVSILSKSKNRFIVSTGQDHDKFELADNMWGQPSIPQIAILPMIDLFITHGGNNSFVEALYFGKPMIVLPLFWDQFDNAQRAVEMNVGLRFDPLLVEEDVLLKAVDSLSNDENMAQRLKVISEEIRSSRSLDFAVDKIEQIAKNPKHPTVYC